MLRAFRSRAAITATSLSVPMLFASPGLAQLSKSIVPEKQEQEIFRQPDRKASGSILSDRRMTVGRIPENGARYFTRRILKPDNEIYAALLVRAGTLNEAPDQIGAAAVIADIAYDAVTTIDAGRREEIFAADPRGGDAGPFDPRDGIVLGFDRMIYTVALPADDRELYTDAAAMLTDVWGFADLTDERIEEAKARLIERAAERDEAAEQARAALLEALAPGSRLPDRPLIPTAEEIQRLTPRAVRAFYDRWFTTNNAAVLSFGDNAQSDLTTGFVPSLERLPNIPGDRDWTPLSPAEAGVDPDTSARAAVVVDRRRRDVEVAMLATAAPPPPQKYFEDAKRDMIDQLAAAALRARVARKLEQTGVVADPRGDAADFYGLLRVAFVTADVAEGDWRAAAEALLTEAAIVRAAGITTSELAEAAAAVIAPLEQYGQIDRNGETRSSDSISFVVEQLGRNRVPTSPYGAAALARVAASTIKIEDVNARIRELFDPETVTLRVVAPTADAAPSEQDLIAVLNAVGDVDPESVAANDRTESIIEIAPAGGAIAEIEHDAFTDVWSAWLDNGVRVHFKQMENEPGIVSIAAVLAGGEIEETPEQRGLTQAATLAYAQPAVATLDAGQFAGLKAGISLNFTPEVGSDSFALEALTTGEDFAEAAPFVYRLLLDPVVNPDVLSGWQQGIAAAEQQSNEDGWINFARTWLSSIFPPTVPLAQPVSPEQAGAITPESAQSWLHRMVSSAPLEIAIVGDIDRDTAFDAAALYFGSLPARERIGPDTLAEARRLPPPTSRRERIKVESAGGRSFVFRGFYAADADDYNDAWDLEIASRYIRDEIDATLGVELAMITRPTSIAKRDATSFPGYGFFAAVLETTTGQGEAVAEAVDVEFQSFAAGEVDAERLIAIIDELKELSSNNVANPRYWATQLSNVDYRGEKIAERVYAGPTAIDSITQPRLLETFSRYYGRKPQLDIVVTEQQDN